MRTNVKPLVWVIRNISAVPLLLGLAACNGQGEQPVDAGAISGSSASSSASSTSNSSSSSSSSTSSSSTTSGGRNLQPSTRVIEAEEFCDSTTGELRTDEAGFDGSGYMAVSTSDDSRVDLPSAVFQGGPFYEPPSFTVRYANGSDEAVPMSLWVNGRPTHDILWFPPTASWSDWQEVSVQKSGQVSLLAMESTGALHLDSFRFRWLLDCTWDCGQIDPGAPPSCPPSDALPGVAVADPTPPEAVFDMDTVAETGPAEVIFDAKRSFDANLEPLTFDWDFGDGTSAQGAEVTRVLDPGVHFVTLTVTDSSGLSDTDFRYLELGGGDENNTPPEAVITASRTQMLRPDTSVKLSATSSADADGDELSYAWLESGGDEVWRGPEIELEPDESTRVILWASDGRGPAGRASVRLVVQDPPKNECSVTLSSFGSGIRVALRINNLSNEPLHDWISEWYLDSPEPVSITSVNGATLSGDGLLRLSLPNGQADLPARSWVYVVIEAETGASLEDISFMPADGRTCVENRIIRGTSSSSSSSSTTSTSSSSSSSTSTTSSSGAGLSGALGRQLGLPQFR